MRIFGWICALALTLAAPDAHALVGATQNADSAAAARAILVLKRGGGGAGFCTGTVIAPNAVITAAHCIHGAQEIAVDIGTYGKPRLAKVIARKLHPSFVPDAHRKRVRSIDMAMLRLASPLPASYIPARLGGETAVSAGQRFTLAGFGVTREDNPDSAGRLRIGEVEAREPLSRILLWLRDPLGRGLGACIGDSGGPVFDADRNLIAVIAWSAGDKGRSCGALTQGILVAPQRGWIENVLASWR